MDVRNVSRVFVAGDIPTLTAAANLVDSGNAAYIREGEVAIAPPGTNGGLAFTDATDTGSEFVVFYRDANGVKKTQTIDAKQVTSYIAKAYAAPAEEIWTIGYNGSAGALTKSLVKGDEYSIRVVRQDDSMLSSPERYKRVSWSELTTTPTEKSVAHGLANLLIKSFQGSTTGRVNSEDVQIGVSVLSNGAVTSFTADAAITVTKGSKIVTFGVNQTIATGAEISIKGSCYIVEVGITAGKVITLDRPYQEASEVIDADPQLADVGVAAAGTAYGLKIFGNKLPFTPGLYRYEKVRFSLETNETLYAPVQTQAASLGSGTYEEVAEAEWEAKGYQGSQYLVNSVNNTRTLAAVSGKTYDKVSISWKKREVENISGSVTQEGNIVIYVISTDNEVADTDVYGFVEVLDDMIVAAGTGTAQLGNLTA